MLLVLSGSTRRCYVFTLGIQIGSKSNSFKAFHCWSSSDLCLALLLLPRLYLFISN
ncbi:Uncharacterised protein [Vibrio cholerae]|nr:Uncharacterised protein [Vibrio cholerae]